MTRLSQAEMGQGGFGGGDSSDGMVDMERGKVGKG